MYCSYCGKEIPEDAKFCPYCGKSNLANTQNTPQNRNTNQNRNINPRPARQTLNKVFSFGNFYSNDSAIEEINTWLRNQSIVISSISILSRLSISKTNTVLSHCEIRYQEAPGQTRFYQMGYFARWHWVGTNFSALDRDLENWKAEYPRYEVIYSTQQGHQYNGGITRTLYFLYISK